MVRFLLASSILFLASAVYAYDQVKVVCLVNQERAKAGKKPVGINPLLTKAAKIHSDDQAKHRRMAHEGSDGSDPAKRCDRVGFKWTLVGENVAYGYPDEDAVMDAWMKSPGHRENILRDGFTLMGTYASKGSDQLLYYTQVFGCDGKKQPTNVPNCDKYFSGGYGGKPSSGGKPSYGGGQPQQDETPSYGGNDEYQGEGGNDYGGHDNNNQGNGYEGGNGQEEGYGGDSGDNGYGGDNGQDNGYQGGDNGGDNGQDNGYKGDENGQDNNYGGGDNGYQGGDNGQDNGYKGDDNSQDNNYGGDNGGNSKDYGDKGDNANDYSRGGRHGRRRGGRRGRHGGQDNNQYGGESGGYGDGGKDDNQYGDKQPDAQYTPPAPVTPSYGNAPDNTPSYGSNIPSYGNGSNGKKDCDKNKPQRHY